MDLDTFGSYTRVTMLQRYIVFNGVSEPPEEGEIWESKHCQSHTATQQIQIRNNAAFRQITLVPVLDYAS